MEDIDWGFMIPAIIIGVNVFVILCIGLVETENRPTNNEKEE